MIKIQLVRQGRKYRPFYNMVVIDVRKKASGAFLAKIGYYNCFTKEAVLNSEIALHWLNIGAKTTRITNTILKNEGILNLFAQQYPRKVKKIKKRKFTSEKKKNKLKEKHQKKIMRRKTKIALAKKINVEEESKKIQENKENSKIDNAKIKVNNVSEETNVNNVSTNDENKMKTDSSNAENIKDLNKENKKINLF